MSEQDQVGSGMIEHESTPQQSQEIGFQQEVTPLQMIAMGIQKGMSPEQMNQLMDLRDREEGLQAKKAFVVAMAKFKESAPTIEKDSNVSYGNTNYSHATLANVVTKITQSLAQYGLHHKWTTDQKDNKVTVTCTITHELGHSESTSLESSPDSSGSKNPIQALGSAVTYLQRYTILAITGLAAGGTDDDGGASGSPTTQTQQPKAKPFYPDKSFDKNFPAWSESIASGDKTKSHLIEMIGTKAVVTDKQLEAINSIEIREA